MIKLHVSICKKVGTTNYGSVGATCGLSDVELDEGLLGNPVELAARIRKWYALAQAVVEDELARLNTGQADTPLPYRRQGP